MLLLLLLLMMMMMMMMMSFDLNGHVIKLSLLTSIEDNLYKNVFQNRLQALFRYFICDH